MYGPQELEAGCDLLLGLLCLHDRADDGDVDVLGTDIVRRRDLRDVDICKTRISAAHVSDRKFAYRSSGQLGSGG